MENFTHAGGVVVRGAGPGALCLIVRPKSGALEWVLPKGHIEPGEGSAQAAVREVREETGVVAAVEQPLGEASFEVGLERVHVIYYLMRFHLEGEPHENRELRWASFEDAIALLTHEEAKQVVRKAEKVHA